MIVFRILSGARAGHLETVHKNVILVGRHPLSDLRFDADRDLEVSARHAEIRIVGNKVLLDDLGSTNGTFINGTRVTAPRPLCDGDVLIFGGRGPKVEVVLGPRSDTVRAYAPAGRASGERTRRRPLTSLFSLGAVLVLGALAGAYCLSPRVSAPAENDRGVATRVQER